MGVTHRHANVPVPGELTGMGQRHTAVDQPAHMAGGLRHENRRSLPPSYLIPAASRSVLTIRQVFLAPGGETVLRPARTWAATRLAKAIGAGGSVACLFCDALNMLLLTVRVGGSAVRSKLAVVKLPSSRARSYSSEEACSVELYSEGPNTPEHSCYRSLPTKRGTPGLWPNTTYACAARPRRR